MVRDFGWWWYYMLPVENSALPERLPFLVILIFFVQPWPFLFDWRPFLTHLIKVCCHGGSHFFLQGFDFHQLLFSCCFSNKLIFLELHLEVSAILALSQNEYGIGYSSVAIWTFAGFSLFPFWEILHPAWLIGRSTQVSFLITGFHRD